jgi:hypothetical protein
MASKISLECFFLAAAGAENRPLSNLIPEQQFVDDAEMSEILANENLLKRMRKGAREAKLGKGWFVD